MRVNKLNVNIKKLNENAVIPKYAKDGDAGFDLVAIEDTVIAPGETKVIKTGVAMDIPKGYEIQIRPRSGVTLKTNLRVQLGTIDSGYRGEIGVIVDNIDTNNFADFTTGLVNGNYIIKVSDNGTEEEFDNDFFKVPPTCYYKVKKGDRIAQAVLNKVPQANFVEVDELDSTERGAGGFGSTGVSE